MFRSYSSQSLLNRVPCVPTCQKRANILFLRANVPKTCHFSNWCAKCQKVCQFFNYFSKEKIFQLWLTLANFQNIWAILENLSRETKNLNFDICLFLLTCYKSCFSYLSCTPQILLKKHTSCKMITKLLYSKTQSYHKKRKETRSQSGFL